MLDSIVHRGPDGSGIWVGGGVGLGLCRLNILDLTERARQPFLIPKEPGVLVYNGEIYNFRELRRELEKIGHVFRSESDTEVVFRALREWGPEKAVPRFNGMFAFAYYDDQVGTLWLARDRAGIKPLYLTKVGSVLAFASEAKALFKHPQVPCRPDMHALTTQVMYQRLAGGWSPFEGVSMVLPGTLVKITAEHEETFTYFDLVRDVDPNRIARQSKANVGELASELELILSRSVREHLVSDAPLAMMCSGGLDSSLLTAMAARERKNLTGYVADIAHTPVDEAEKARVVCQHTGVTCRPVPYSREDFLRDWPASVYHNDRPQYFPQNLPSRAVCRAAHRDGFKVLLGGEGADELFGGYSWQQQSRGNWMAYRRSRLMNRLIPGLYGLSRCGIRFYLANRLSQMESRPFDKPSRLLKETAFNPRSWALDGAQRHHRAEALFEKLKPVGRLEDRAFLVHSFEDFHSHLRTSLRSTDKMAMSQSIEMRVPFLDNHVIDFGLHAPLHAKLNRGRGKWVVKQVANRYLPKSIIHAKKVGFGIESCMWKGTEKLLRGGMVAELFKWDRGAADKIHSWIEEKELPAFHLVSMELWARIFLRGESPDDLAEKLLALAADSK